MYLLMTGCLLWASIVLAGPVSVFCPSDISAVQFGVSDIQRVLEQQGSNVEIVPISKITEKQQQTQFVLGLASDNLLLTRLQVAGGQILGSMAPEGYAIRVTRRNDLVTVWAIGADATGAMYAGLALAETIAHDGIKGIEETDCQPYITGEKR